MEMLINIDEEKVITDILKNDISLLKELTLEDEIELTAAFIKVIKYYTDSTSFYNWLREIEK